MISSTLETPHPTQIADHDTEGLADRLLKLSFAVNLVFPAFVLLCVYVLRAVEVLPAASLVEPGTLQIVFYALLFVAVSEVGVAYVLKKSLFSITRVRATLGDTAAFTRLTTSAALTLAAVGAAKILYGIVLYMLGLEMSWVALFGLLALVHFRLFRPSAEFLRSLITQAS